MTTNLYIPFAELEIDPAQNVRSLESYEAGSSAHGQEEASLSALQDSLRSVGQQQPIGVVRAGRKYRVVFGFRRVEALRRNGEPKVWAALLEPSSAADLLAAKIAENVARKRLNPFETARAISMLYDADKSQTHEQIGRKIGLSRQSVQRYLSYTALSPAVWAAWARAPYALPQEVLDGFRVLPHAEQDARLRELVSPSGPPLAAVPDPVDDAPTRPDARRGPKRAKLLELRTALAGGRYARRGDEWVRGATEAVEYALGIREGLERK